MGAAGGTAASLQNELYEKQLSIFVADEYARINKLGLEGEELKAELIKLIKDMSPEIKDDLKLRVTTSGKFIAGAKPLLPEQCHNHLHSLVQRTAYTYLICVDGSAASDLGFSMAMAIKKRNDRVLVCHTFSLAEQQSMPVHYQRDSVKSKYESMALIAGMNTVQVENCVYLREREEGETFKDSIVSLIEEYREVHRAGRDDVYYLPTKQIDFCVIGYTGRRGAELQQHGQTVMGSATDLCLRQIHMPIFIAKAPLPPAPNSLLYVFAIADTERSKRGIATGARVSLT